MLKVTGEVIHGRGNGKKVGMPTANLDIKDIQIKIEYGVYACYVYVKNKKYLGVCNVGIRPTIDSQKTIEVNIIDFDEDIYGEIISIELIQKLRDIEKFNSLQEVKKQVDKDIVKTRELLS